MGGKRQDYQPAVAQFISDHTANNYSETEAGETGPADRSQFEAGKAILTGPVVKNPPRRAKPTPAARIAVKPAQSNLSRFAIIPSSPPHPIVQCFALPQPPKLPYLRTQSDEVSG